MQKTGMHLRLDLLFLQDRSRVRSLALRQRTFNHPKNELKMTLHGQIDSRPSYRNSFPQNLWKKSRQCIWKARSHLSLVTAAGVGGRPSCQTQKLAMQMQCLSRSNPRHLQRRLGVEVEGGTVEVVEGEAVVEAEAANTRLEKIIVKSSLMFVAL